MVPVDGITQDATTSVSSQIQASPQIEPTPETVGEMMAQTENVQLDQQQTSANCPSQQQEYDEVARATREGIAARIQQISDSKVRCPDDELKILVELFRQETDIRLTASQVEAVKVLLGNRACIITAGAGFDRAILVSVVVRFLSVKHVTCRLYAPGEDSTLKLEMFTDSNPQTIDRLLNVESGNRSWCNKDQQQDCGLLVVSRASMVGLQLMFELLRDLPETSALMLVGDLNQHGSVGPENALEYLIGTNLLGVVHLEEASA